MYRYKQLNKAQRHQMEILIRSQTPLAKIATLIGVHRSTIYRELNRNKGSYGSYSAEYAQQYSNDRKERLSRPRKLDSLMEKQIMGGLINHWSPEQISGYYRSKGIPMLSHEQIYRFIYKDKANGGTLFECLRIARKPYRKRYGTKSNRTGIPNRVSIDERPEIVNKRLRVGDWEADTIIGKGQKGAILTLVERKSLFVQMALLEKRLACQVRSQMINILAPYKPFVKTITSDNGTEFADHQKIAKKLSVDFYFTHPYSAWEKGINENTNGLIRQFIPKKTNFTILDKNQIRQIEYSLNSRPRKSLGWRTPL
jgi:transposase, IS30 family